MTKADSMPGQRFGSLVVVSRAPNRRRNDYWNCQCDCGNAYLGRGSKLRAGHTTSCGCQGWRKLTGEAKRLARLRVKPERRAAIARKGGRATRHAAMVERFLAGETLQEIADRFGVTRQYVDQITDGAGLSAADGGQHIAAQQRKAERQETTNLRLRVRARLAEQGLALCSRCNMALPVDAMAKNMLVCRACASKAAMQVRQRPITMTERQRAVLAAHARHPSAAQSQLANITGCTQSMVSYTLQRARKHGQIP